MRFGILGPLLVTDDQGHELALGGRKQRAVLALLLLHAGESLSTDRLIDELWGEHPPAAAAKTLQVYVSKLRKALGDDVLFTRAGGYVLELDRREVDVARFQNLVAAGHNALSTGAAGLAVQQLNDALGLWRGSPLADFEYESFAQPERTRLEEVRQSALEDRVDAELVLGDHARLIGELEALVAINPLREHLHAQLMLALYRSGRQAEALDVYQRLRSRLADDLGLEPGPELRALQQRILEHAPTLSVDAAAPQPVAIPRGAASTGLPQALTPLVGRTQELDAISELLSGTDVRLVTLLGPGGIGKTRLAVAVARRLHERFEGGVFMVRLAGVSDPASILPMIAERLEINAQSDEPLSEILTRRLSHAPTLVVLDNFEQLAVSGASRLADLLSSSDSLWVLATSQVPLRVRAEHVVEIGPLGSREAAELFADRAHATAPGLVISEDDRVAIQGICARLDNMPLAIELAAARVRVLGARTLERRLERPLELLTSGERDLPERQRSLRASIEWTHALLTAAQQRLLARLAVCVGPAPLGLVDAVAGPQSHSTELLDEVQALLEFSFARRDERPRLGVRFIVPQALRDFALERLVELGEEHAARRGHAEYVAATAREARHWKWGATDEQRNALRAVMAEVRPAVAWTRANDPDLHVRICGALAPYWVYAGVLSEIAEELRRARDSGAGSLPDRAMILTLLSKCLQLEGDDAGSAQLADQALAEWADVTDAVERASGLQFLSWIFSWADRHAEATAAAREALELVRPTGDRALILRALVFVSQKLVDTGDVRGAEACLTEADELAAGDPVWELTAIHGDCALVRGDYSAALRLYAESLAWTCTTGESHQMLMDLRCLALSLVSWGEIEPGLEVWELVRLEEQRTGRKGDVANLPSIFGTPLRTARQSVSDETFASIAARARAVPAADRAQHAIGISLSAIDGRAGW